MFSVWDKQTGKYLYSGRNSKTKEQALEEAFSFWEGGNHELTEKELELLKQDKEGWLSSVGLVIHKHKERIEDSDW